jgi:Brp/Blh family beta-carotene 15,15'-monooxygenase
VTLSPALSTGETADLGRQATKVSIVVVVVAVIGLAVPGMVAPHAAAVAGVAAFLLGIVVGVPHGAVDHEVLARAGDPARIGGRGPIVAGYAVVAAATLTAVVVWPVPAVLMLLVLSAVHFGAGEVAFAAERDLGRWRPSALDALPVVGLGGAVVVVPLVRWPTQTDAVLGALAAGLPGALSGQIRWAAAVVVAVALVGATARVLADRRRLFAVEILMLVALFVILPPLPAFGAYFGGWHAVRHVARLVRDDPRNGSDLDRGHLLGPMARYARAAAVPTARRARRDCRAARGVGCGRRPTGGSTSRAPRAHPPAPGCRRSAGQSRVGPWARPSRCRSSRARVIPTEAVTPMDITSAPCCRASGSAGG